MAVAAGAVMAVGGVTQSIVKARQAKKQREAINNYQRQDLKNVYGDLTVSTRSADLQREELARFTASGMQTLQSSGVRGVLGGVGVLQSQNINASRAIGADLDRQQRQIDQLRSQDEIRIQSMQEARENADLAGMGAQLNAYRQESQEGIATAMSGAGALLGSFSVGSGANSSPNPSQGSPSPLMGFNPNQYAGYGGVSGVGQQGNAFIGKSNPYNSF